MSSLLLNADWDISLDSNGDVKTTEGNYAIAQNTACRCRAFTRDMYFNQADGVPHFLVDISKKPNLAALTAIIQETANATSGVKNSNFENIQIENRKIHGDLGLELENGEVINVRI